MLSWGTLLNAREVLVLHFVNFDRFSLLIPLFKIAEVELLLIFLIPALLGRCSSLFLLFNIVYDAFSGLLFSSIV